MVSAVSETDYIAEKPGKEKGPNSVMSTRIWPAAEACPINNSLWGG